ncbi:AAA family ATPase [Streptomyces sp.]|uniref:AAA family ATPase n=1 Tax=Streptomyces sp. TaxID=1931 RepID=UPI002D7A3E8C|nr:AAA family ATPase [Streptomyces sp.]HET6353182.1 AAA family ATPase [Streptomyces sp.]
MQYAAQAAAMSGQGTGVPGASPGPPGTIPDLIGREAELAELRSLLGIGDTPVVTERDHMFVLVRGGFGSGKSALLRALLDEARADDRAVLDAWADPGDSRTDHAVLRQLLESAPPAPSVRPSGEPPEDGAYHRRLATVVARLAADGRRPLICVDDLQWADTASLRLLRRLMRRADGSPPAVIASLGPGESPDEDALGAVLPLFRDHISLPPLALHDTGAVLARTLGHDADQAFLNACQQATDGNHFLLRSLLGALAAAPPQPRPDAADGERTVSVALGALLPELAPAVRSLLRGTGAHSEAVAGAVAVLGSPRPVELIAEVTSVPQPAAEDAVHTLVRAGILHQCEQGVAIAASLLSDAVEQFVAPSRRQELHAGAARFLLARVAAPDQVAHHVLHCAPGQPFAPEVLRRAAAEASDAGAHDRAALYLRRALREPLTEEERAAVLCLLGEAELESSVPTAIDELRRSLQLSKAPSEQTSAARRLAGALFAVDRYLDALDVLERTSAAIRPVDPSYALRLEIDFLFISLVELASAARAYPRLMDLAMTDASGTAVERPLAALLSLRGAMVGEDAEEVVRLARIALGHGLAPADDESVVYHCAMLALGAAGRPDLGHDYAEAAIDEARARGAVFQYAHAVAMRGNANARLGRTLECEADAEAALEALLEVGVPLGSSHTVFAVATLIESLTRQGRIEEAQSLLERSGMDGQLHPYWINDYPLLARGWLRVEQGRLEEGLADFLACGARTVARNMPAPGFYPWRSEAALVHARLGHAEEAVRLAEEEVTLARRWGVPEMTAVALRALGIVTGGPEGLQMLDEAVGVLETSLARFRYAQALADRGALAMRCSRILEARADLQEAVSVAHACNAGVVAQGALRELRALGDRPRTRTFQGVDALTPTERRVADLAAGGMTNREIAQHLFVGLRTVEIHLTHVYGKLGIKGRQGLAEALR